MPYAHLRRRNNFVYINNKINSIYMKYNKLISQSWIASISN